MTTLRTLLIFKGIANGALMSCGLFSISQKVFDFTLGGLHLPMPTIPAVY
jgi:hypothetical protein